MKTRNNKVYVVTPVKIENWDETGTYYRIVLAQSKTQAAAAYAASEGENPGYYGIDESNPADPYVYPVKIPYAILRTLLQQSPRGYEQLVREAGAAVLNPMEESWAIEQIVKAFLYGPWWNVVANRKEKDRGNTNQV